jgi:predicted enzyme related to lactoylglutathione lyase
MRLSYVMKFVEDMGRAVSFYRDTLGLTLRFASPEWSEFETGGTTLALHLASDTHPAGSCQIGFNVEDIDGFFQQKGAAGVVFTRPPTPQHGMKLADFVDCDGAEVSVSG